MVFLVTKTFTFHSTCYGRQNSCLNLHGTVLLLSDQITCLVNHNRKQMLIGNKMLLVADSRDLTMCFKIAKGFYSRCQYEKLFCNVNVYSLDNSFYYISIHDNKCMGENLLNSGIAEACFYQSSYVLHFCSLRLTRRRHVNLFVQKPMIPKSPRISRN